MINIIAMYILLTIVFILSEGVCAYIIYKLLLLINKANNPDRAFHIAGFFMILFIMVIIVIIYVNSFSFLTYIEKL